MTLLIKLRLNFSKVGMLIVDHGQSTVGHSQLKTFDRSTASLTASLIMVYSKFYKGQDT